LKIPPKFGGLIPLNRDAQNCLFSIGFTTILSANVFGIERVTEKWKTDFKTAKDPLHFFKTWSASCICRGCAVLEIHLPWKPRWGRGRSTIFQSLNRYNSAADCLILLKFATEFDYVTAATIQSFKVKESKVKVTA